MARDIVEGDLVKRIKVYDYGLFVYLCIAAKEEGFFLKKAKRKIRWPFFWIVRYKAKFIKPFISVDGESTFIEPKSEWLKP